MESELKQRWIEALRSGNYKQGDSVLRTADDRYCCLGVLCDLIDGNIWAKHDYSIDDYDDTFKWAYNGNEETLPHDLCETLRMSACGDFLIRDEDKEILFSRLSEKGRTILTEVFELGPHYRTLAVLNDKEMSFEDIAIVIEYAYFTHDDDE